ncbi:MCP four helix bundle domain-containing protein [Pandoraea terrae]|nr:MCP four helix bundle domain-containing protein [Pandoraea terrae]
MLLALLAIALARFIAIEQSNDILVTRSWAKADAAHTISSMVRGNARRTLEYFTTDDPAQRKVDAERIARNLASIQLAQDVLDKYVTTSEGHALIAKLRQQNDAFILANDAIIKALAGNQRDVALDIARRDALPTLDVMQSEALELVALQRAIVEKSGAQTRDDIAFAKMLMSGIGAAAVLLGIGSVACGQHRPVGAYRRTGRIA